MPVHDFLAIVGIILVLLAIAVPVVRKIRESARQAVDTQQRQAAPLSHQE